MATTSTELIEPHKPLVMIVGGGLGGMFLGILLERAHIPFHIFERASAIKPLGAGVTLSVNILPVIEQLGLLDDVMKIGLPFSDMNIYNEKMRKIGVISSADRKTIDGYDTILLTRRKLYDLLLKQIPEHKITLNKRVVSTEEKDDKVYIHCADDSTYAGDILVGADGAYSSIRQGLFKDLDARGLLPKSDLKQLARGYVNIVGTAKPDDPNKYPQLKSKVTQFDTVIGTKHLSWGVANVPGNEIVWGLAIQLTQKVTSEENRKSVEWNPNSSNEQLQEFYDLPCPWGGKMGDIVEATPMELRSKVFLEEKVFETWYHGRTVLIGDGAVSAFQDAVVLSNCLYDLLDSSPKSIKAAFQDYYEQRYHHAVKAFKLSSTVSGVMTGTITWLPRVPHRGTGTVSPQKPSKRYADEQAQAKAAAPVADIVADAAAAVVIARNKI
ncbi:hypothetical protein EDD11_004157 [Mortierella claussenii]|nr:hypothetical protein EDD11_004157 [Mortierella claussenii]